MLWQCINCHSSYNWGPLFSCTYLRLGIAYSHGFIWHEHIAAPENAAFRKSSQVFAVKEEKHKLIKLLAQTKLDSIFDSRLHEMQEGSILPAEFHNALQELEQYCKLKVDIKYQDKIKVRQITKKQQEELLEQEEKEGQGEEQKARKKFYVMSFYVLQRL